MVEQSAVNRWVVGSSPTSGANTEWIGGQALTLSGRAERALVSEKPPEKIVAAHNLREAAQYAPTIP